MFTFITFIALFAIAIFGGEWSVRIVPRKKKGVSSSFRRRANAIAKGYESCTKRLKNSGDLSDSVISLCPISMDILTTAVAGFVFYNVAKYEFFNLLRVFWLTFIVTELNESPEWAAIFATGTIVLVTIAVMIGFFHCRMMSQIYAARSYFRAYIVIGKRPIVKEEITITEALLKGTGLLDFFRRVIKAAKEALRSEKKISRAEPCA